jgi:hypothetical protein
MRRSLEVKTAEVTDDFLEGLKTARCKFKKQLAEVEVQGARKYSEYSTTEAQAKHGSYQRTETDAGMAQTPKFDDQLHGLCSNASLRPRRNTMAGHLARRPHYDNHLE